MVSAHLLIPTATIPGQLVADAYGNIQIYYGATL
nr:MAG TPA: hypothetical protein [Caudoviricetes sp.]